MKTTMDSEKSNLSYKLGLTLAAIGIVYGDIGTSPLYALKEAFGHSHIPVTEINILGILSLVFWSLALVISVKYVYFILKANFNGEGGILALSSLIQEAPIKSDFIKYVLLLLGVFGAALLYGDGIITPAISVLGAMEGLQIVAPNFQPFIIPFAIVVIVMLFKLQKKGTGTVSKIFAPVMILWFLTIAALGIYNIVKAPQIFYAINPYYAVLFFNQHSFLGFTVLGSIVLVITGGEALYSDLGHFGIQPIKWAWFYFVLPCLLLNYFGQGAFLLVQPSGVSNPFYLMAPKWSLYPLILIATLAATIASQALISGIFSLTMQAVQKGYMPRFLIQHTSEKEYGQIYIKSINRMLMAGAILLVLFLKTSSALALAYGVAVTATMFITTILFYFLIVYKWKWNRFLAAAVLLIFITIDLAFLGANLLKLSEGGWLPFAVGIAGFIYMTTWKKGRRILGLRLKEKIIPLDDFFEKIKKENPQRIDGAAIFMNRNLTVTPYSMVHFYEHFKTLHKDLMFMTVVTMMEPKVSQENRYDLVKQDLYYHLTVYYGFLEKPDIPQILKEIKQTFPIFDPDHVTFILSRENIFATETPGMALWREKLFAIQSKNEMPATEYFNLPRNRVVEIGAQVTI